MLEEWLIDGYNLLHSVSSDKSKKQGVSREALFELLASFASSEDRKVLMVLDGHGNDDEWSAYRTKVFSVQYSQSATADTVIEKILYERKESASFVVVTQDHAVSQIARGCGARVMKPGEFMVLIQTSAKEREQILFHEKVRSHGFNRPFDKKLKSPVD